MKEKFDFHATLQDDGSVNVQYSIDCGQKTARDSARGLVPVLLRPVFQPLDMDDRFRLFLSILLMLIEVAVPEEVKNNDNRDE